MVLFNVKVGYRDMIQIPIRKGIREEDKEDNSLVFIVSLLRKLSSLLKTVVSKGENYFNRETVVNYDVPFLGGYGTSMEAEGVKTGTTCHVFSLVRVIYFLLQNRHRLIHF